MEIFNPSGSGLLGMNCELLSLTKADGSALLTQGGTAIIASVSGPIEVKLSTQQVDNASFEVYCRPKIGPPTLKHRLRETVIKNICETTILSALYPRTSIAVQVQEMENGSELEACVVNAVCLALLVGGIPMKFTVAAVNCIVDENNKLVLDPDQRQTIRCRSEFTFVFDSLQNNLVTVNTKGCFSSTEFNDAWRLCKAASENIFLFYRKALVKVLSHKT